MALPKKVSRVVLVGNKISPGQPSKKDDGTVVRTVWGDIAWQLGGKEGYALVKQADETATNPGDALGKLLRKYTPCLILIDEWVAYARGLHDTKDLPGGDFETQFTFAQTLTEEVKSVPGAMLVVSLPASADGGGGVPSPLRKRLTMVWGGILGCVGGKFWVLARMRWVYWSRVRRRMPNWKPNVRNLCQKQPGRERSLPAVFRQMAAQRQCPKLRELGGHLYPHPRHISSEA